MPYVLRPSGKGQPHPESRSDQLFEFDDDHAAKREVSTPTDVSFRCVEAQKISFILMSLGGAAAWEA